MKKIIPQNIVSFKIRFFTLIELLVVLSIVTMLCTMLISALKKVREEIEAVSCKSNLKQLGIAWMDYLGDSNGIFMTSAPENDGHCRYWRVLGYYLNADTGADSSLLLYKCPSETVQTTYSYGSNIGLTKRHLKRPPWSSIRTEGLRIISIDNPSEKVLMGDGKPFYSTIMRGSMINPESQGVSCRHDSEANYLFFDTSVNSKPVDWITSDEVKHWKIYE